MVPPEITCLVVNVMAYPEKHRSGLNGHAESTSHSIGSILVAFLFPCLPLNQAGVNPTQSILLFNGGKYNAFYKGHVQHPHSLWVLRVCLKILCHGKLTTTFSNNMFSLLTNFDHCVSDFGLMMNWEKDCRPFWIDWGHLKDTKYPYI